MKKIVVCLAVAFLFGTISLSSAEYNNSGSYKQSTYTQPEYVQLSYDQETYDGYGTYDEEFITGEKRQQLVQGTDRSGRTVQAVVPVGTPDEEIDTTSKD